MIDVVIVALIAVAFYMGWNIGANDTANCMGTVVGGGILSHRRAIMLFTLFATLGCVTFGYLVMKTVGADIVVAPAGAPLAFSRLPVAAIAALVGAGLWVTIATFLKLPVSTSHSIVGGVIGAGILILYVISPPELAGYSLSLSTLQKIMISWILTPVAALLFAFVFYHVFRLSLRGVKDILKLNRIYAALAIITGTILAFSLGANDVGNATGAVYAVFGKGGVELGLQRILALFGGVALSIGAITYSKKVIETVGSDITGLGPATAFVGQLGAAVTVMIFTLLSIPVSTSHAIVGAVIGVGLVRGMKAVKGGVVKKIVAAWVLTPFIAALISLTIGFVLMGVT